MLEPDLQVRHRAIAEWLAQDRAALLARTGASWRLRRANALLNSTGLGIIEFHRLLDRGFSRG